jgi:hypothetical protein
MTFIDNKWSQTDANIIGYRCTNRGEGRHSQGQFMGLLVHSKYSYRLHSSLYVLTIVVALFRIDSIVSR